MRAAAVSVVAAVSVGGTHSSVELQRVPKRGRLPGGDCHLRRTTRY